MNNNIINGFSDYLNIIKRRWVIVLSVTVLILLAMAALCFYILSPVYESSATIIVSNWQNGNSNNMQYDTVIMYQKLMKTYSEIATSESVFTMAQERIGKDISLEQLKKSIKVTPRIDTQILQIKGYSGDPKKAQLIVGTLSGCFMEEALKVFPVGKIYFLDRAGLPKDPVQPNKVLYMASALVFGLIFSIGLALILDTSSTKVKSEKDIAQYIGIPILACIPVES